MKIEFDQELKGISGDAIPHPESTDEKPKSFLLRDAVLFALVSDADAGETGKKDGERKFRRFMLSQRIYGGETEITAKELGEIEELIEICPLRTEVGGAARMLLKQIGNDEDKGKKNANSGS